MGTVEVAYHSSSDDDENDKSDPKNSGEDSNSRGLCDASPNSGDGDCTSGWAIVMSDILNKKVPEDKPAILAKGSTDKAIFKKRQLKESTEKGIKVLSDEKKETLKRTKKHIWEEISRVKPSIAQKEKERNLQRIATKGVVQLFNAVKKQQKIVEEKFKEIGTSEFKRSKVVESVSKGAFLDSLKGPSEMTALEEHGRSQPPTWSVLRDDFMLGAKMKDWDQASNSSGEGNQSDPLSDSD